MKNTKILFIIPCPIIEDGDLSELPIQTIKTIHNTHYFIAERAKTTRRFIKQTEPPYSIQDIFVEELDKHNDYAIPEVVLSWFESGREIGLLSEAGCPCIADPGFHVVREARKHGYKIVSLVGPSSLFLALMASGLNGQQFSFHGYLSNDAGKLKQQVRQLEEQATRKGYSQLFIETPYRNVKMMETLLKFLQPSTLLNVSINLSSAQQVSETKTVKDWKNNHHKIDLHKSPAVFIIGR